MVIQNEEIMTYNTHDFLSTPYLHLSLSVAVAVTAMLRLVLEAAQVNIAPWSALVTEP